MPLGVIFCCIMKRDSEIFFKCDLSVQLVFRATAPTYSHSCFLSVSVGVNTSEARQGFCISNVFHLEGLSYFNNSYLNKHEQTIRFPFEINAVLYSKNPEKVYQVATKI